PSPSPLPIKAITEARHQSQKHPKQPNPVSPLKRGVSLGSLKRFSQKRVWFKSLIEGRLNTDLGAGETRTVYTDVPEVNFDTVEWLAGVSGETLFCFVYASYYDAFAHKRGLRRRMRRTLLSAVQTGRNMQNSELIMSACERGNRST
ncbi:MAG: hypothetical protein ACU0C8_14805, partial [Roseovarius sp.]